MTSESGGNEVIWTRPFLAIKGGVTSPTSENRDD